MADLRLKDKIAGPGIIVAPGIYDHMSLLLANEVGFDAIYASGYWGTASAMGEPDVGIAGYSDFIGWFAGFASKSKAPVIADADTGFGSLANLAHAVRGYQRAGIAAMQIEDQPFPKICGHSGLTRSVASGEMVTRIQVAVEARGAGDMLIIARTDARSSEGLDAALNRLHDYAAAGADIVFLEAPESSAEIAKAGDLLKKPLMINAVHGGKTPVLNPEQYAALGVKVIIYPAGAALSAAAAVSSFYRTLAAGDANSAKKGMFDFPEMSRLLGLDEIAAFQERHRAS